MPNSDAGLQELAFPVSEAPDIRLLLRNRADNVALVRQALGGLAEALEFDDALLDDMKTAVSEACNNVVLHAYDGGEGPLEVDIAPEPERLVVTVRDEGTGIKPRPAEPDAPMQGVGLSLITALTDRVEFHGGGPGEGTEVRMVFVADVPPTALARPSDTMSGAQDGELSLVARGEATIVLSPGRYVASILSGVIAMLAARAGFSIERLSDAQLITDALAAHAPAALAGPQLQVGVDAREGELDIKVGPLVPDGARRVVRESAVGGLDPLLERLADGIEVSRDGDGTVEALRLTIGSRR